MKKITLLTISMLSVIMLVACGGGSSDSDSGSTTTTTTTPITPDPVPNDGEPCPNPEAHEYYNMYAPIATEYELTDADDLKNRLNFFDKYSSVVGSNTPETISNLITNSSILSSFYSMWNSVIGDTTVEQYNTMKNFYNSWNSTVGSSTTTQYSEMKSFYDTYYETVSPYNLGQIQQYINGALYINTKKLFINDILHYSQTGQMWNKTSKITYGFTTGKATDIHICIINKANYAVIDSSSVVTRYTDGFTINITPLPAGTYIVTVSGYYTVPGASYQDTETGSFYFSR